MGLLDPGSPYRTPDWAYGDVRARRRETLMTSDLTHADIESACASGAPMDGRRPRTRAQLRRRRRRFRLLRLGAPVQTPPGLGIAPELACVSPPQRHHKCCALAANEDEQTAYNIISMLRTAQMRRHLPLQATHAQRHRRRLRLRTVRWGATASTSPTPCTPPANATDTCYDLATNKDKMDANPTYKITTLPRRERYTLASFDGQPHQCLPQHTEYRIKYAPVARHEYVQTEMPDLRDFLLVRRHRRQDVVPARPPLLALLPEPWDDIVTTRAARTALDEGNAALAALGQWRREAGLQRDVRSLHSIVLAHPTVPSPIVFALLRAAHTASDMVSAIDAAVDNTPVGTSWDLVAARQEFWDLVADLQASYFP